MKSGIAWVSALSFAFSAGGNFEAQAIAVHSPYVQGIEPPVTVRASRRIDELCDGERISFSPNGDFIVSHSAFRQDVSVFEVDCLFDDSRCSGWRLDSISGVQAIVWTTDEIVYLVPGDGEIRRFEPRTGRLEADAASPLRGLPRSQVVVDGPIDSHGPAWDNALVSASQRSIVQGVSLRGEGRDYALQARSPHMLEILAGDRPQLWHTDLSGRWSAGWRPARDRSGQAYLVGAGVVERWNETTFTPALPELYQPRPIIDASTGILEGGFDDQTILGLDGQLWGADPLINPASHLDFIEDVAIASTTGVRAIKVVDLGGGRRISVTKPQDGRRQIDCPARETPFSAHAIQAAPTSITIENWGSSKRPLMVRRRNLLAESRGLLVFWPGGPGRTFSEGGSGAEQAWLKRGFDVVTVDGSGSRGIALGRRLRQEGFDALIRDADAVARHLSDSSFDGTRLIVLGGSFGGIAAAETARRIGARRLDRPLPELLLIAPWLRYRAPSEYNLEGRERFDADYVVLSDEAAFGRLDVLAERMSRWRTDYSYRGSTLAIFAGADRSVRVDDLWDTATSTANVTVVTVPSIDHRFLPVARQTNEAIEAWLDGPTVTRGSVQPSSG